MNILDAILNAQNGAAVSQLGSQVGLGPDPRLESQGLNHGRCVVHDSRLSSAPPIPIALPAPLNGALRAGWSGMWPSLRSLC